MSPRQLTRIALHLLLAVSLVIPGIVAPAQAIADGVQAAAAASLMHPTIMEEMPCGDMGMPASTEDSAPSDCCTPHTCDLSACLGTACLPELPHLAANVPPAATPLPWQQSSLPPGVIDTPLRPPIV
jgi:hypothetical protein